MKAPKPKSTFEPVPAGTHIARLFEIIHVGTVPDTYQGETRMSSQVRLNFELCNEKREFDGVEKPLAIAPGFKGFLGFSMGKKSKSAQNCRGNARRCSPR
jgi:hypothetical protein